MDKDISLLASALQQISDKLISESDLKKSLISIAKTSREFLNCDNCLIWLYEPENEQLVLRGASGKHEANIDKHFYKENEGLTWEIFAKRKKFKLGLACEAKGIWRGKYVGETYPDRIKTGGPYLGVPILFGDKCLGTLAFGTDNLAFRFTDGDLAFALVIANEIAGTVYNINMHFENQLLSSLNKERLEFLSSFGNELLHCKDVYEICKLTTNTARRKLNCRSASIYFFSKTGQLERRYIAGFDHHPPPPESYRANQGVIGKTLGNFGTYGQAQICNDIVNEPLIQNDPIVKQYVTNYETAIKSELGISEKAVHLITIPLNGKHRTFGILRIVNKLDPISGSVSATGFTEFDKESLLTIASLVAFAVSKINTITRLRTYFDITDLIGKEEEKQFLDLIAQYLTNDTTFYSACLIHVFDKTKDELQLQSSSKNFEVLKGVGRHDLTLRPGEGVAGKAFLSKKPILISDFEEDPKDFLFLDWIRLNKFVSMICLPLKSIDQQTNYGTLSLFAKFEYVFYESEKDYLTSITGQISLLVQQIRERHELALINRITENINQRRNLDEIFELAVMEIPKYIGFDECRIIQFYEESGYAKIIGIPNEQQNLYEIPISNQIAKDMLEKPRIMSFANVPDETKFDDIRKFVNFIQSMVIIPIQKETKKVFGLIVLYMLRRKEPRKSKGQTNKSSNRNSTSASGKAILNKATENLYQTFANQLAIAIKKNEMFNSIESEYKRKQVIESILHQVSSDENLNTCMDIVLKETVKCLEAECGCIALFSKASKYVVPGRYYNLSEDEFPLLEIGGNGLTGWVYRNKKAYLWPGGPADDEVIPLKGTKKQLKTEIIAPLIYSGKIIGILLIGSTREFAFDDRDKDFVQTIANETAVLIQDKQFYQASLRLGEVRFDEMNKLAICNILAQKTTEIMSTPAACVWLIDNSSEEKKLVIKGQHGARLKHSKDYYDLPQSQGGLSWETVQKAKKNLTSRKGRARKNYQIFTGIDAPKTKFKHPGFAIDNQLTAMISMPLIAGKEIFGVINTYASWEYFFFDKEISLLRNLAISGAIALKNAELSEQTQKTNEKILEAAQLANPGIVALSFSHDAKHSMHNINALISSLLYLVPKQEKKSERGKRTIEALTTETDALRNLFQSLVSYAKAKDSHNYRFNNLTKIIDSSLNLVRMRLKTNHIECIVETGKDSLEDVRVECEERQIEQVLINLFNNAIYAIRQKMKKGGRIRITIKSLNNDFVGIQFMDNGIGIIPVNLDKIFETLYTTKGDEGSGFGLSICKRIIEDNHMGSITVRSTPGESTAFFIKLPKRILK